MQQLPDLLAPPRRGPGGEPSRALLRRERFGARVPRLQAGEDRSVARVLDMCCRLKSRTRPAMSSFLRTLAFILTFLSGSPTGRWWLGRRTVVEQREIVPVRPNNEPDEVLILMERATRCTMPLTMYDARDAIDRVRRGRRSSIRCSRREQNPSDAMGERFPRRHPGRAACREQWNEEDGRRTGA